MTIIPRAIASLASFERVEAYLLEPIQRQYRKVVRGPEELKHTSAIRLMGVRIGYTSQDCAVLQDINLAIPHGSFVACLGRVGSGKTSLTRAIAGNLEPLDGSIMVASDKMSLCLQQPWLPAGTLEEVICGTGGSQKPEWYSTVIQACCLDSDVRALPNGHHTQVGSRGGNLSGGQRQRVVSGLSHYNYEHLLTIVRLWHVQYTH